MNRKEALKYAKFRLECYSKGDEEYTEHGEFLVAAIKALQEPEQKWIPVSERLPEVEDLHEISIEDCMCYLIQRSCGVMDVAHYIKVYGESYFEAHCIKFNDVVAWMPLPEPYKE